MVSPIVNPSQKRPGLATWLDNFARRFLDILASFLAILILSPFFLIIAMSIQRDSSGPIIYRGQRAGRNGKPFGILKFRTMYDRPESYSGSKVTANGDHRITPTGKWLRDTKLNELPQLWNVLKGEMSLVGPRPEDIDLVKQWPEDIRREILSVRPGITSPASILYRDEENQLEGANVMEDYLARIMPTKLRLDVLYVRNRTILTDLDLIFWTAIVLLPAARRISIPQNLLYWGPLSLFTSRYLAWFLIDLIIALLSIAVSGLIWRSAGPLDIGVDVAFGLGLIIAMILSMINSFLGLRQVEWSRARPEEALLLMLSTSSTTAILIMANTFVLPRTLLPNGMLLVMGILALFGFVAIRYRSRLLTGLATSWIRLRGGVKTVGERVIIVGAGENGILCSWLLNRRDLSAIFLHIIGFADDSPKKQGVVYGGIRVLGTTQDIPQLVKKFDIGLIVYSIENIAPTERIRILNICKTASARLVVLPDTLELLRSQIGRAFVDIPSDQKSDESVSNSWADQLDAWNELAEAGDWDRLKQEIRNRRLQL
jgi:lipopolysaccharide/colanic/teichoic acid biosynthesis glycosyltransferase